MCLSFSLRIYQSRAWTVENRVGLFSDVRRKPSPLSITSTEEDNATFAAAAAAGNNTPSAVSSSSIRTSSGSSNGGDISTINNNNAVADLSDSTPHKVRCDAMRCVAL